MKEGLIKVIDRFSQVKILVLGDFLLDEFVFGEISRVSREAPVLILKYKESRSAPGGGANTVANVEGLGATVVPVGFVGDDKWADTLLRSWSSTTERRYVFRDAVFQTTRKIRLLAGSFHSSRQQVVRLDHENPCHLQARHEEKMVSALRELVPQVDGIIVSDYSLGNVNPRLRQAILELAHQHGRIIVVDSRVNLPRFKGATSMTPNVSEIEVALATKIGRNRNRLEQVGSQLRQDWNLSALLVTRGNLGMSLFENDRTTHIPIFGNDEVADVTGAGDTVIATYATALAAGGSFRQSAWLANYCGGLVVMKQGTAVVSQLELRQALENSIEPTQILET